MKKQTFIQGTIYFLVIGMIVKVLGTLNRLAIARYITGEGLGIYMMVMPTFILIISLAQLGFPIAISKLVSENNIKQKMANKTIVFKAFKISLINSVFLMILLLVSARFLSHQLLNEKRAFYPILCLIFFIPLVSFTSILKGYLNGYKIMSISANSQLVEQIIRVATSMTLIFLLLPYGVELAVCGAILSISLGELSSLIYMIYKIKNKRSWALILSKPEENYDENITKDILMISLPATGSRLIGSVSHFLEPIFFSMSMLAIGISSQHVTKIYGQITGYTLSLLLVPSFFCVAVSTPLIPMISEAFAKKNEERIGHYFNLSIFLSFLTGCIFTVILTLYPKELMKIFFNTQDGTIFLSYMAPLFLFHYFQMPITSTLHSINKANPAMINTFIGAALKIFLIFILVKNPAINVHGLTIAIIVNSLYVTFADFLVLRKSIKIQYNFTTIILSIGLLVSTYLFGHILKSIIPYSLLNILLIIIYYVVILLVFNIGDILKLKSQITKH